MSKYTKPAVDLVRFVLPLMALAGAAMGFLVGTANGVSLLGAILGVIGIVRIAVWQEAGFFDYGEHWMLVAATVGAALIGIVTFGSLTGSMLPFLLQRLGFDPATASAPFVATLVDVTGLVIYFSVAWLFLHGTVL